MRIIGVIENQGHAESFNDYLLEQGIESEIESLDPSSHSEGGWNIWIYDEDQLEEAKAFFEKFNEDPKAFLKEAKLEKKKSTPLPFPELAKDALTQVLPKEEKKQELPPQLPKEELSKMPTVRWPFLTLIIMVLCIVITIEINQGIAKEDISLLNQLYIDLPSDPNHYWEGEYQHLIDLAHGKTISILPEQPLFEKVSQGQWWRLFTPAFVHINFLHLLFNILWLLFFGAQIENRMGYFRYLLFILIAAAFSNVLQYFVGGYRFIGFSGVVCAMLTYVWSRSRHAPWEGYQLQSSTFNFLSLFILGTFLFQCILFVLELYLSTTPIVIGIANTAHIAGLFIGLVLGQVRLFRAIKY